ncbi:PREDICTED: uncharacterized protein C5orf52-like [Elephantulus edwardii]|uniref:uncharacterized protein C5orf52-like n=1 Tax=Elephantulus edwardii TaxID=28737 RepID=UPI0003F085A0|nr:PREDICTED: uncharacterized protein C5orf52-like [Elephantulus edwardii]
MRQAARRRPPTDNPTASASARSAHARSPPSSSAACYPGNNIPMDDHGNVATTPDFSTRVENSQGQSVRPSVTWDLSSPSSPATTPQAPSGSGSIPQSALLQRDSQNNRHEVCFGAHPQTCFQRPRPTQAPVLFSVMNSSDVAATKFLPKSHLSRVIIRDNLSAQRVFEMETKASEKSKRKTSHLYDHLKKKFITDQLRKLNRWRHESLSLQQYMNNLHVSNDQAAPTPEPQEKPV